MNVIHTYVTTRLKLIGWVSTFLRPSIRYCA